MLYYLQFQKYHHSAIKLEAVAETFTKIAEAYVRHTFRIQYGNPISTDLMARNQPRTLRTNVRPGLTTEIPLKQSASPDQQGLFQPELDPASLAKATEPDLMDHQLRLDEATSLDPSSLFDLFSYSTSTTDFNRLGGNQEQQDTGSNLVCPSFDTDRSMHRAEGPSSAGAGQYVSMRDVEINGQNQFSNCTFDWFGLERYEL